MTKKIICMLLTIVMVMSLFAGCGINTPVDPTTEPTHEHDHETIVTEPEVTEDETPEVETTVPETETPTEAPTEETKVPETEAPTETTEPPVEETKPASCQHDYKSETVNPTCTNTGYTKKTCTKCGHSIKTDEKAKLGHDWDNGKATKNATCDKDGVKTYTCERKGCGQTKTETITKLGHDWNNGKVTKDATCTAEGSKTYTCERNGCGKTKTEAIAKLGHSWGNWVQTKAPTTEAKGQETRTCNNCGKTETRSIDKLPADDGGDDEGSSGGYYVEYGPLGPVKVYHNCASQGHISGDITTIKSATCCTPTMQEHTCKVIGCGHKWTVELNDAGSVGHVMSNADRAKVTKGNDFYDIACICGLKLRRATRDEALAALNAHAAEKQYDYCGEIMREGAGHTHEHPDGAYTCVNCGKSIVFKVTCAYNTCTFG